MVFSPRHMKAEKYFAMHWSVTRYGAILSNPGAIFYQTLSQPSYRANCLNHRRHNKTQELIYVPPGQPLTLPPKSLANGFRPNLPDSTSLTPAATERAEAFPLRVRIPGSTFCEILVGSGHISSLCLVECSITEIIFKDLMKMNNFSKKLFSLPISPIT